MKNVNKYIWKMRDQGDLFLHDFYSIAMQVFKNRDINEDIINYFNPSIESLHDPFLLQDMIMAIDRIEAAIKNNERIIVYGDYDVDGITSIATLKNVMNDLGIEIDYYIPDRMSEGYGVNLAAIKELVNTYDLLITVDCGITSIDEIDFAMKNGLDVIVTDHHMPLEKLPNAIAVINPKRKDNKYPNDVLAGVGVIFKTCEALLTRLYGMKVARNKLLKYMDIVAVGTVADIVPLTGENRTIVSLGLKQLNREPSLLGLKELIKISDIKNTEVASSHISFRIAPRLNAGGRVGSARDSLELLLADTKDKALELAMLLDNQNEKRKNIEKRIEFEAIEMIENDPDKFEYFIMLYKEDWHHGVLGIVASRLVERYYRPVILFSKEDDYIKGSGRSISALHMQELLTNYKDLLLNFGGHAMAVGVSMDYSDLTKLHDILSDYVKENCSVEDLKPKLVIDTVVDLPETSLDNIREVAKLRPFGIGNRTPTFLIKGCEVLAKNSLGQNRHTKLVVKQYGTEIDCLFWQQNDLPVDIGDMVDIVGKFEENIWRNKVVVNFIGKDIRVNRYHKIIDKRNISNKDNYIKETLKKNKTGAIIFYGYNYGDYSEYIGNDLRPLITPIILYFNNGSFSVVKSINQLECKDIYIYDLPYHHHKLFKVNAREDICLHLVYNNNDSKEQLNSLMNTSISRKKFADFYRFLNKNSDKEIELCNSEKLLNIQKLTMLKVFEELKFLAWQIEGNTISYSFNSKISKRDLSESQAYKFYTKLINRVSDEHKLLFSPINMLQKIYLRRTINEN